MIWRRIQNGINCRSVGGGLCMRGSQRAPWRDKAPLYSMRRRVRV
jgi:hypothetical protein